MNTLFRSSAKRLLVTLLTLVSLTAGVSAQTASDYHTPTGIAPGAPAGSYALSNFEHINLFNGGLNFRLPLLKVGGRGGVSHTIWLPIDHRWEVGKIVECEGVACTTHTYVTDYRLKTPNTYYGPGKVIARHFGDKRIQCYQRTITRLTFQSPDGTEYDLRDTHAWGRFYETMSCDESVVTRGKIFKSVDGSSITFISDTEIKDKKFALAALSLNGWLKFADGTKYRVTNDLITLAIDRNGNRIKFEYDTKRRISKMTDSLDRQVTITYEVPNGLPNGNEDQIRYTGFDAAAPRLIRILSTTVGNAMHPDYTPRQMKNLFPGLSTSTAFPSARVVSSIVLPNNESYSFLYNDYGELARVVLPTGGRFEYKTEAGVGGGPSSGAVGWESPHDDGWWVYRRLVNRKVFSGADTFIGETDYSKPEQQFTCGSKQCTSTAGFVEVTNKDAAGNRLAREKHYFYGSAARSYDTYPLHWPSWKEGREHTVETFDGSAAAASRRVEMTWKQRAVPWWTGTEDTAPPNNPQAAETKTTLLDTSPVKVSKSSSINPQTGEMAFDQYHNRTDFWEYDFGDNAAGPLLRHTRTQYVDSPAYTDPGVHLLSLPRIVTVYDAGGVERSRTELEYDNYADDEYHEPLVPRDDISGLCMGLDSLGNCTNPAPAGFTTRGNVTAAIHHLLNNPDSQAGPATAYQQYDIAGNVVKAFDAGGHATTFVFDDRFGVPDAEATSNTAPVELGAQKSYGFVTSVVNALGHTTHAQYDYYTGEVVNTEDANGAVGSFHYADPLDRPSKAERAVNIPGLRSQTTLDYDDQTLQLTTTSDLKSYGDNLLKSVKTFDGFGREVEARRYESATSYVTTKKAYDALGRVATTYNPYRSASDETYGRSTISYDAFSRVKQLDTFDKDDASTGTVLTTYDGLKVTVTDQSGRKRRTETDALGRIVLVTEPNGAGSLDASDSPKTVYKYDVLGNMTEVRVGAILQSTGEYAGGQTRTFVYDSHSRLILERVPEQEATLTDARAAGVWSARYTYGADGRLKQKADARGKTITYLYDALGRLKSVDYTDTTPDVTYTYDTAPGGKGLPASVKNSASTYRYEAYDELGRVKASSQTVHRPGGDVTYTMPDYSYDRAGNLVSQTYPSGRVVTTDYDAAGRVAGVRNQSGFYYAGGAPSGEPGADDRITYAAHGAVSAMRLGNGLWEHSVFNSRLQPAEIGLGTTRTASNVLRLEYGYGEVVGGVLDPTKNNGNIRSQSISVPAVVVSTAETIPARTFTQTYAYDPVNRLRGADEVAGAAPTWTQGYLYDTFGNRRLDESQTRRAGAGGVMEAVVSDSNRATLNPVIDPATNRVSAAGYAYDEAGNLLCDPAHQCSTQPAFAAFYVYDAENRLVSAGALAEYFYDGDGKRVRKVSGTQETVFVYDVAGRLVAEYSDAGTGGGTSYLTQDHLGSTRVVTGQGGANDVKGRFDYQPFGQEVDGRAGYGAGPVRQKFTGYERDDETGLDFAQARYYAKALGRFTSVDPNNYQASRTPYDPQSWNAYSYAKNNPLNASDPSGKGIDDDWQLFITTVTALATAVRMTFEERVKSDREYLLDWERHMKGDLVVQSPHGGSPVRLHPSTMNSVNVILWADHMRWLMDNGGRVQSLPEGTVIVDSADIALGYRQRKERVEPPPSDIQNPQAHHEMPQKFRDTFKKAGIDIDAPEHIRWVEASKHLSWSKKFNQVWDDFLRQNPNATKEQILEQMRRMQNDPRFPSQ